MRILLTGEYELFGSKMAERLKKEGHEIIFLCDREISDEALAGRKEKFYYLPYNDERCEEVFRIANLDMVIYNNFRSEDKDKDKFISGLIRLTYLAKRYQVKKFVTVYMGDGIGLVNKEGFLADSSYKAGVIYCQPDAAGSMKAVNVCLYNVYGPDCKQGLVFDVLSSLHNEQKAIINGNKDNECVFTYINDAVEAVYQAAIDKECQNIYHFIPEKIQTINDAAVIISETMKKNVVVEGLEDNIVQYKAEKNPLGWVDRHSFADGLNATVKWLEQYWEKQAVASSKNRQSGVLERFKASLENCGLFAILVFISIVINKSTSVDAYIGLDYSYIYIMVMGLLYGKKQSLPATFAAMILLTYTTLARGADFVGLFYESTHIVHLASYLFVGVFTGYVADNHERLIHDAAKSVENLAERYDFLEERYLETVDFKDKLYRQIINSNDSIGRVYQIASKLSAIEVEEVFTAANDILMEIMEVDSAAIYICGRSPYFLRLKTRSGNTESLPKSLRIEQFQYLEQVIKNEDIFINRQLEAGFPDMAAPIIYENRVIAVMQIYGVKFENFDRQHEVLLKVTAMLIADALGLAYRYETDIRDKKYVPSTRVLRAEEFNKVWQNISQRDMKKPIMLKIESEAAVTELSSVFEKILREDDYLGLGKSNQLYLLIEDVDADVVEIVRKRISDVGINTTIVQEAEKCLA